MLYNVKYTPGAAGTFRLGRLTADLVLGTVPSSFVSHAGDYQ